MEDRELLVAVYRRIASEVSIVPTASLGHSYLAFAWDLSHAFTTPDPSILAHRLPCLEEHWEEKGFTESSEDPLEEAIYLAHEYGHHKSFLLRQSCDVPGWSRKDWVAQQAEYLRLVDRRVVATIEDRDSVVAEEERAWEFAFDLLREVAPDEHWRDLATKLSTERIEEYRNAELFG